MGARQSRRSVDITTTPKKDGVPSEGGVGGDAAAPGDGKLERIEETDSKPISNGVTTHAETAADKEDKDKDKDETSEKDKEKVQPEDTKAEEAAKPDGTTSQDAPGTEGADVTTPSAEVNPATPNAATSPESKETKKKDKLKKKWSFRSISFSKKDKNKPTREDTPKNGDVTKEEPLAESGEEVESTAAAAASPAEEKSAVSSSVAPEADSTPAAAAAPSPPPVEEAAAKVPPAVSESANATVESKKEEEKKSAATETTTVSSVPSGECSSPAEKKEEPSPSAPTPVPVEEKKEEIEKVEVVAAEKVEVSPVQTIIPVEVSRAQPIATPSIIERKTSEDLPSLLPSSPPPTPIDPSPLQQAQQAAANASAIAEALKLPAETAHEDTTIVTSDTIIDTTTTTTIIATSPLELSTLNTHSGTAITDAISDSLLATSSSSSLPTDDCAPAPTENSSSQSYHAEGITSLAELPSVSESGTDGISPKAHKSIVSSLRDKQIDVLATSPDKPELLVAQSVTDEKRDLAVIERQDERDNLPKVIKQESQLIFTEESLPSSSLEEIQSKESIDPRGDLVIQSEEGPLPISGEMIVEAKPALVIPEDNLVVEIAQKNVEEPSFLEKRVQPIEERSLDVSKKQIVEVESEVACPLPPNVESLKEIISAPIISAEDVLEDDVPPPLPDSPAPILNPTSESFIPDNRPDELIGSTNPENREVEKEITLCPLPSKNLVELTDYPLAEDVTQDVDHGRHEIPLVSPTSPTKITENLPEFPACPPSVQGNLDLLEDLSIPQEVPDKLLDYPAPAKAELPCIPVLSNPTEIPVELDASKMPIAEKGRKEKEVAKENTLPTPPRSPKCIPSSEDTLASSQSFPVANASETESSRAEPIAEQNTEDFKVESCDVTDIELNERLTQSKGMNGEESTPVCPFSKATSTAVLENEQSTPESEPAEKEGKPSANETSTTESVDEAPTSPPPAVPMEVSQTPVAPVSTPAPALAPAITEDVASVTKAIEEIDINEKAVAAAVNEAIESANANELVTDSCHQNNMNE